MTLKHAKTSAAGASSDPTKVGGDDWNADHVIDSGGARLAAAASVPATPPAASLQLYAQTLPAGSLLPAFVSPDGVTAALQPYLGSRRRIAMMSPQPGTTGVSAYACGLSGNGTYTTRTISPSTLYGAARRLGMVGASGITSQTATFSITNCYAYRGVVAHTGGFRMVAVVGAADPTANSGARCFYGLTQTTVLAAGAASLPNLIGVGCDESDGGLLNVYTNDATGVITRIPLGSNFPAHTQSTDLYEVAIYCAPNDSAITVAVTRVNTGDTASVTVTTDLPVATALMFPQFLRSNGATTTAVGLDFSYFYLETEL